MDHLRALKGPDSTYLANDRLVTLPSGNDSDTATKSPFKLNVTTPSSGSVRHRPMEPSSRIEAQITLLLSKRQAFFQTLPSLGRT